MIPIPCPPTHTLIYINHSTTPYVSYIDIRLLYPEIWRSWFQIDPPEKTTFKQLSLISVKHETKLFKLCLEFIIITFCDLLRVTSKRLGGIIGT